MAKRLQRRAQGAVAMPHWMSMLGTMQRVLEHKGPTVVLAHMQGQVPWNTGLPKGNGTAYKRPLANATWNHRTCWPRAMRDPLSCGSGCSTCTPCNVWADEHWHGRSAPRPQRVLACACILLVAQALQEHCAHGGMVPHTTAQVCDHAPPDTSTNYVQLHGLRALHNACTTH